MRLATAGLAEKFKNIPMSKSIVTRLNNTLSTVHHQLLIMLRLFLEKLNNLYSPINGSELNPIIPSRKPIIQNLNTTVVSFHPNCSK